MATHLILGGARSGKSNRALQLASQANKQRVFIATGQALDAEMAERIERHRTERGDTWQTIEEPLNIARAIQQHSAATAVIVVDCLTLWLSNLLHAKRDTGAETDHLTTAVAALPGDLILVSNEVGFGLVPQTPMGRRFRDAQGRLNQSIAQACDRVELVVAGLPLSLKE